jgi:hypothetical protein
MSPLLFGLHGPRANPFYFALSSPNKSARLSRRDAKRKN